MGTRASVIFKEKDKPMFAMYRHYDGYPTGLGEELKAIISGGTIVNGLGSNRTLGATFNGAGCLFATIISKLKDEPGNVYMCHIDQVGNQGEDYIYEVNEKGEVNWGAV